jgi:hypothetical protein
MNWRLLGEPHVLIPLLLLLCLALAPFVAKSQSAKDYREKMKSVCGSALTSNGAPHELSVPALVAGQKRRLRVA